MNKKRKTVSLAGSVAAVLAALTLTTGTAFGQAVPGGTLDPMSIPKYVTPLVIPPVMENSGTNNDYDIAVRQFKQQILPAGFPATTVWSYGPAGEDRDAVAALTAPSPASQFNYPAYTIEAIKDTPITVDWVNDLVDPATGNYRPHLLPIDRTLHWANPEGLACYGGKIKDCRPDPTALTNPKILQEPYAGPVPVVVHVHGAHVGPESDGYPEAWWLPDANNIPGEYSTVGTLVNGYASTTNNTAGIASFRYPNDQPSTTLWYHDHTLGMTRNNVYAGPAGFWLIRDAGNDGGETGLITGTLPGPAPVAGQDVLSLNVPGEAVRASIREIPIVIQDRSFNDDGSLFYPANRAFFEGIGDGQLSGYNANPDVGLNIETIGNVKKKKKDVRAESDIAPIWNPEAFFNVMVVNGVSWPTLEVEPDLYRFRLLNGSNSRFINLSMFVVNPDGSYGAEVPFYQIGADQSLMPHVVKVATGTKTILPGDGTIPADSPAASEDEALLMGLAERADVLVDFSGLPEGTVVRMINTAPDAPFGGFPDIPADPDTSGQVMQFAVGADTGAGEDFTAPEDLALSIPDADDNAYTGEVVAETRDLALLEEESIVICAVVKPDGTVVQDKKAVPDHDIGACVDENGAIVAALPFGPKAAVLGTNGAAGGRVQLWADPIRQNVGLGNTETWELWNWSADAHPIHLHLVKFKVINREAFDEDGLLQGDRPPEFTEDGWKDTVISYPGEVTRVRATFDLRGLYVWHCHIVEHEDNEMMVPFCVGDGPGCDMVPQGL
jgi:FtsP/CotA-like multicopper oxidase with cupredoxin domain